ncbi:MAG: hypothetical protein AAGI88_13750 [Pseudomonadota bacterium]
MGTLKELMDFLRIIFFSLCGAAIFCFLEFRDESWSLPAGIAFSAAALVTLACWIFLWLRQWRVLREESAAGEQRLRDEVSIVQKYGNLQPSIRSSERHGE